jgi:hypothetical protein
MSGRSLREGLAALGVVLSLVFVGTEIRQNTIATRAATLNDLAAGSRDWLMSIATNPELASVWRRWLEGDELTDDDLQMAEITVNGLLRNVENVFLQVRAGAVDESALVSYGFGGSSAWESPHFPEYWARRWVRYHPEFVAAFEQQTGVGH